MRMKSMLVVGFLTMIAATGVLNAPGSFAADQNQRDVIEPRIGHGGTYSSSQPDGAADCQVVGEERRKVDVIERIGAGGSIYSFSQPLSAQASDCQVTERKVVGVYRIGHGGSIFLYSQPNVQTAGR